MNPTHLLVTILARFPTGFIEFHRLLGLEKGSGLGNFLRSFISCLIVYILSLKMNIKFLQKNIWLFLGNLAQISNNLAFFQWYQFGSPAMSWSQCFLSRYPRVMERREMFTLIYIFCSFYLLANSFYLPGLAPVSYCKAGHEKHNCDVSINAFFFIGGEVRFQSFIRPLGFFDCLKIETRKDESSIGFFVWLCYTSRSSKPKMQYCLCCKVTKETNLTMWCGW